MTKALGLVRIRINGFYYESYNRDIVDNVWDSLSTEHNFRIRFAPEEVASYRCRVRAEINGHGTLDAYEFTFSCAPSYNKGFMRVGDNNKYFVLGESTPYFPIGQNLVGPNNESATREWSDEPVEPKHYANFLDLLEEYAAEGGNYYRYIASPWQTEIEFEHLGNYGNRMTNAWEFDKIVDKTKELDIKMHFNMAMHYTFESPNGYAMTHWDWSAKGDPLNIHPHECFTDNDSGYCYRNELDILDPVDFLTDSTAKAFYKKRLRYIIARWGYSTGIGAMELMSEVNNFGNTHKIRLRYEEVVGDDGEVTLVAVGCEGTPPADLADPSEVISPYRDSTIGEQFRIDLFHWQHEMLSYIKDDLGHTQHPFSACYTGIPNVDDPTYESGYVDIPSFNYYRQSIDNFEVNYTHVVIYHDPTHPDYNPKPFIHSEYGPGDAYTDCDQATFSIRTANLTPFIGLAASGLSWHAQRNEDDRWKYLKPVTNFLKHVPLDEENWAVAEPIIAPDLRYEIYYLQRPSIDNKRQCVGVLSNRTFNVYTNRDDAEISDCANIGAGSDLDANLIYTTKLDFDNDDLDHDIKLPDMGGAKKYNISWYNAITGNHIVTIAKISGLSGDLKLRIPDTLTGDITAPMMFFKVFPEGDPLTPNTVDESEDFGMNTFELDQGDESTDFDETDWSNAKNEIENQKLDFSISPNPTLDIVTIEFKLALDEQVSWSIIDIHGNVHKTGTNQDTRFNVDLVDLSAGNYYIQIVSDTQIKTSKLIKL